MIDATDRATPRFPAHKAEAVRAAINAQLAQWKIGQDDLALCGGACGADIIFAEEALGRGARLRLLLAQEANAFIRDSVARAGSDWVRRFETLCERAEVAVLPEQAPDLPNELSIYARTNLWIIATARAAAPVPDRLHALLVWDEQPTGDGPGGTSDFESRVRDLGGQIAIINPTKIA